jgi:hypothetical protein
MPIAGTIQSAQSAFTAATLPGPLSAGCAAARAAEPTRLSPPAPLPRHILPTLIHTNSPISDLATRGPHTGHAHIAPSRLAGREHALRAEHALNGETVHCAAARRSRRGQRGPPALARPRAGSRLRRRRRRRRRGVVRLGWRRRGPPPSRGRRTRAAPP